MEVLPYETQLTLVQYTELDLPMCLGRLLPELLLHRLPLLQACDEERALKRKIYKAKKDREYRARKKRENGPGHQEYKVKAKIRA